MSSGSCASASWSSIGLVAVLGLVGCADDSSFADAGPELEGTQDARVPGEPPDTELVTTPAILSNAATARFELASVPTGLGFQCSLDGAVAASCTSPHDQPVDEGEHTLSVAAFDADALIDPSPATFTWRVDLTPPDTGITEAPAPLDNSSTVSFGFAADEDATFACSTDGATAVACTAPHQVLGLLDGPHRLDVTATDLAGNVDPTPATHAWTIDTSTPDTRIDSGPNGAVASTSASFGFTSPDAGAGAIFTCTLDGAAPVACTSPRALASLAQGAHTFTARVRDATGNVDPTPATRTWTVDTVAPTVTITIGPTGPTSDNTPSFTFTTTDAPTVVRCRIDAATPASCTSPFTAATLADGAHTFFVTVSDAAGNSGSASRAFSVDTAAPAVTITEGPTGATNDNTPSFGFTTTGAPTVVQCRIDAAAPASCASPFTAAALASGAHTFFVTVSDAAGNSGSASRAFSVDTVAPTLSITSGPAEGDGFINATSVTFGFSASGATGTLCRLYPTSQAAPFFVSCSSPITYPIDFTRYTFQVLAYDDAGNQVIVTRNFRNDWLG